MPNINVIVDIDKNPIPINRDTIFHTTEQWTIGSLRGGMQSGRTSVMLIIHDRESGVEIVAEQSLQNFINAATILASAHRDEITRPGYVRMSPTARSIVKGRIETRIIEFLKDPVLTDRVAEQVMLAFEEEDET